METTTPHNPRHGLIVEDLPDAAAWLTQALQQAFPDIAIVTAESLAEARACLAQLAPATPPDIALIDLGLPDGNGVDLISEVSERFPSCACVITTIFADDSHLFPALRAGAQGYLLKDQPLDRTVRELRGISAGEPPLSPTIANRLLKVFNAEQGEAPATPLSTRETEALILISKGFKLTTVAEHMGITHNTAADYVKSVYRKLKISSRAEAALEAARMGLVRTTL